MRLRYGIDTPLDTPLRTGMGTSLILEGWAYCPELPVVGLMVELAKRKHRVIEWGNARQDVMAEESARGIVDGPIARRALLSGFWLVLPIVADAGERHKPFRLLAELRNGDVLASPWHNLRIAPAPDGTSSYRRARWALSDNPRICICMATYNPTEAVFRRQVDSIRAQDYSNWVCLIQDDWSSVAGMRTIRRVLQDDPRFVVDRNEHNVGFYANFERVLQRVPADCRLVCLADQDDRWYPDKLAALAARFVEPDVTLAYSDMRIVDDAGNVVSDTFWSRRRNNYTDLETLFFANTITGAASMFRTDLLPRLLPFPQKRGHIYHDWWIGLVALATGRIAYVDRPLHDYYQHSGNVVGWSHIGRVVSLRKFARSDPYRRELAHVGRSMYNYDCKSLAATIQTLRLRVPESPREAAMNRLARLPARPLGTLLEQVVRSTVLRRASENREKNVFMAHAVMRMLNVYLARKYREILQKFSSPEEAAAQEPAATNLAPRQFAVDGFERKCTPLELAVRPAEPPRVNMFLATIDFRYFFGGYIGMFQLARHIAQAGFRVRFILTEHTDFQPQLWRRQIAKYAGLEDIFDLVEVEYRFDRSLPLPVSPKDRFIATSCWTAYLADSAARQLGKLPFIFMIQEYEPFFVPHGTYYALSHAAYDLNLFGVFSTEILREFFRRHRYGVYRHGVEAGDARSIAFHNALVPFEVDSTRLARHIGAKRKFLFYCRPEAHAQRNMFELGILALRRAMEQGALDPAKWDFYGIGTVGEQFAIPLPHRATMTALPKMSLAEYAAYLPDFDLGMSLMLTPHPSLVPLEMAGAGLIAVTNSYENKTAEALRAISGNFEVGAPTIEDLAAALTRGEARVEDHAQRVAGASLAWPTSWDEAFSPEVMRPLLEELGRGGIQVGLPSLLGN